MGLHHRLANKVLPIGSRRRERVRRLLKKTGAPAPEPTSATYDEWIRDYEHDDIIRAGEAIKQAKMRPLVSIIVPCYNTPDKYLLPLVESIFDQQYDNWQLILADGSNTDERQKAISTQADRDERIKYHKVGENLGIVGNTNVGLKLADGEFVAFMDHDDTLAPHALSAMVLAINDNPKVDLLYSDEDKLSDDGKQRQIPFFKPDWSPELLLGVNYITHFVVVRKKLIEKVGGLRPGFDGAQDYDFLLRLTEEIGQTAPRPKMNKIVHVPKMLYHWRLAEGSTAKVVGEKNYADTAGQRALKDAVKRRGIKADVVEIPDRPTNYRLRYHVPAKKPLVSIIIPFKDKIDLLKVCVPSIFASTYDNYEIILVSNNSVEPETFEYLDELKKDKRCKVFIWDHPFNYSKVNNFGRSKAKGEYLIFLNNDTEVLEPTWIEELVGVASQPDIGAVGPLLVYPDRRIQHAGIIIGMKIMAGLVFRLRQPHEWTDFGLPLWPRNYIAVIGACTAIKAERFDSIGCFDERVKVGGSDVIPCIKLHEKGLRNIYWPFARLVHYENASVGSYESSAPQSDYDLSLEYYGPYHKDGDPYFNPNLDLMNEQIGIRSKYE